MIASLNCFIAAITFIYILLGKSINDFTNIEIYSKHSSFKLISHLKILGTIFCGMTPSHTLDSSSLTISL